MKKQHRITILVYGPFAGGKGHEFLEKIRDYCGAVLEGFGTRVLLVPDLFPVRNPAAYPPEEARECSRKAIEESSAALLVFLSPQTLGVAPGEYDLTGGAGWEFGVMYEQVKKGRAFYAAFLFDSEECRSRVSTLLRGQWQGRDLEAVARCPGDIEELCELALQLCISLSERVRFKN